MAPASPLRAWLGATFRGWAEVLDPQLGVLALPPSLPPPPPTERAKSLRPPDGPSAEQVTSRALVLLERARDDVLGRIRGVNQTTERETLAAGDALQKIVKEAQAQATDARGVLEQLSGSGGRVGVPQLAKRQSDSINDYLRCMGEIMERHDETVKGSHESSRQIVDIGKSVEKVAFQARLLSLNAAIEAARLGGHGSAFGVIAEEMTRLSTEMDVANRKIRDLAEALMRCLPQIVAQSAEMRAESSAFSQRMSAELVELQDSSAKFERGVKDALESGDERVARVVSGSYEALSRLSFQDACAQRLLSVDAVLKQLARRLQSGEDDGLEASGFDDVQRNSTFNAGEVISLRDTRDETPADGESVTADAGEVLLF